MTLRPEDFGASFKTFLEQMASQGPSQEPPFLRHLRTHFGTEPTTLPTIVEKFEKYEHANLHVSIEDYVAHEGRSAQILGILGHDGYRGVSLADLVAPSGSSLMGREGPTEGPVQYVNVRLDGDRVLSCVQCGLYLIRDEDERLAVLVHAGMELHPYARLKVEVMAPEKACAERFLASLRTALRKHNVYRGHVLSLAVDEWHSLQVQFHHLPRVCRESIILPEGLLERIERQTIGFGRHSERLLAAGRHLKRGVLFHGLPGTGKTLTAMYLAAEMRGRTILLLTGRGLGLLAQSCALARTLQPSIVILEDVDLVAEERTRRDGGCATPLLFELLNEMDGLADDADILFLLTTNRPDILEPALAARPGRIDQAFEIPLPDENCRRRLLELYGRGLTLRVQDLDHFIGRTKGASAAFLRELLRKAALFAADDGQELVVTDRHLDDALHELVVQGGELTQSLLGFRSVPMPGR
jgi:hypothetical protein